MLPTIFKSQSLFSQTTFASLFRRTIQRRLFIFLSLLIIPAVLSVTAPAQISRQNEKRLSSVETSIPRPLSINKTKGIGIENLFAPSLATGFFIDFENPPYVPGTINGQDGWSSTGSVSPGGFDHKVVANSTLTTPPPASFGAQSLRISNAVTSGSFGDQTFSKSLPNEAGETSAQNGAMSGGTRKKSFEAEFSFASAVPGAQQTGLTTSISPDRGDGARMGLLRFEDQADGIHVLFVDYQDFAPFGTTITAATNDGCDGSDNFITTDIATLDRSLPYTIKLTMDFFDGQRNDVVKVYIDGVLKHTGTSWEDYFRFCEGNPTRTVDSLLFRTAGTAAPANQGNGFLFDNLSLSSSSPLVVDDDGMGSAADCNSNDIAATSIQAAINSATAGDTIRVCPGTYAENITVNKQLTILGPNSNVDPNTGVRGAEAIIVPTSSDPLNPAFGGPTVVTFVADGITFKGFTVDGDNTTLTSGVAFNGADVDAEFGIYGTETANPDAVITNNIVKNIGEIAVWINSNSQGGAKNDNSLISANKVDNVLGNFGQGIRISDDAWLSVLNNVVTRVRVGIVIENYSGNTTTHPASVIGNNNVSSFRIGIRHNLHYVYGTPGFTISNNTVTSYVPGVLPPQVTLPT
ncbi:MAG: hypothetical protein M3Q99_03490, partial [Acidobacteriota bacterium]|nr:hypothetical protein [Acidobacteriota bacterium]